MCRAIALASFDWVLDRHQLPHESVLFAFCAFCAFCDGRLKRTGICCAGHCWRFRTGLIGVKHAATVPQSGITGLRRLPGAHVVRELQVLDRLAFCMLQGLDRASFKSATFFY